MDTIVKEIKSNIVHNGSYKTVVCNKTGKVLFCSTINGCQDAPPIGKQIGDFIKSLSKNSKK